MVEKGQKLSKMAKKNTNLDFEKTGKNNKQKKIKIWVWLYYHATRKYLQLLNLKLYDWLSLTDWGDLNILKRKLQIVSL